MMRPGTRPAWAILPLLVGACSDGAHAPPPATATRLHAVLPSLAVVGRPVDLLVSPLDDMGTPDREFRGQVTAEGAGFASRGVFQSTGHGTLFVDDIVFREPGIWRITVKASDGREAIAGPVRVVASAEALRLRPGEAIHRIYWGDCHGHSDVGDGTHPPENYFFYAREVAHLDFTCLSEHDYQQFLDVGFDADEGSWDRVSKLAREWRRPGFAVLTGWEWSSLVHGHRVVLFPNDDARYVSYRDVSTPAELALALQGSGAFSVIAHPAGSQLTPAIQWSTLVPGFDRAIEIYSGHGAADDDPTFRPTTGPKVGATALDAIRRGHRLAFVGFSDTHLTTPGNPSPPAIRDAPYRGGLTAVLAPSPSESDVFAALRDGRCYATSGARFLVEISVADRTFGETLELARGENVLVRGRVAAPDALVRVEVMADDRVARRLSTRHRREIEISVRVGPFPDETAVWLRGESESGERFWTTPVWVWERAP